MVVDSTISFTLKIEERVMRDVYMCCLICLSKVLYLEFIFRSKSISHENFNISRHSFLTVGVCVSEYDRTLICGKHIPYYHVKTFLTSVEGLTIVVLREVVCLIADCISSLCNSVRIWSYNRTKETLTRIIDIRINVIIS